MLNIVVPMAGRGSRFLQAGFAEPKPLIPIHGMPMIRLVIGNIRPSCVHRFIFICQRAHVDQHGLRLKLGNWSPGCEILELDGVTQGAACTVLSATPLIDNDDPLMIANSDQYVDIPIDRYLESMAGRGLDGLIMTMRASDPKWSFAAVDAAGLLTEVAEKKPISPHATVGIYNYRRGRDFVAAAGAMIRKNLRVNNEFYVAPVYNEMVATGAKIGIFDVGSEGAGMYGIGTPDDLRQFAALSVSRQAAAR